MNEKKFVNLFLFLVISILLLIVSVNFIVDPLYNWGKINKFDFKRNDFDERLQKTNYLANIDSKYDALLLGNSRSTYLNVKDFDINTKIFNYSVNAMSVYEYDQVIKNFISLTGNSPKTILIGIDPFDFSGQDIEILKNNLLSSKKISVKLKNLISIDVFAFSLKTLVKTIVVHLGLKDRKQRYYNNELIKGSSKHNIISNNKYIQNFDKNFKVDYKLLEEYKRLKEKYNNIDFLIYCLPFHGDLLKNWQKESNFELNNEIFLSELIKIFGNVYYFNYNTDYNTNYLNFYDSHHFYPSLGKIIIQNINILKKERKSSYGFVLDKDNYKNTLKKVMQ